MSSFPDAEVVFVSGRDRVALLGVPGSLERLERGEEVGRDMEKYRNGEEYKRRGAEMEAEAEREAEEGQAE